MIAKLKKLRGRSFAELAVRGGQKAAAIAERAGVSADAKLPGDAPFLRLFRDLAPSGAADLLTHFRHRESSFYPSLRAKDRTLQALRTRFPAEENRVIELAERLLAGRFHLLGYADLHFTTVIPDWHLDPVSEKRSPLVHWSRIDEADAEGAGDRKIVWELNRHQYFSVLGRAYWITGDDRYAEAFIAHLADWIEKNPPKVGVNWVSSLEISYRSVSWIWAFYFFRDFDGFSPDLFLKMLKCLYMNARHVQRHLSTYSSPNTHLTGEAFGLYVIGSFLGDIPEAAHWKEEGRRILEDAVTFQIRDDGGYVEQSTQYQRYTADIYLSYYLLQRAEAGCIGNEVEPKLRKMLEFLMHVTQPDGSTSLIGDDDGGRLHFPENARFSDFRSTLAVGAAVLGDGRFKFVAGEAHPEVLWLTGTEGLAEYERIKPVTPTETVKAFEQSGVYVIRDGWGPRANFVLIDCGEHGFMNCGHAHADALGFVLSVKGKQVFVDSGTFTYTGDPIARNHFRGTSAHNCMTVDGESSSLPGGAFSWRTTASARTLGWRTDGDEAHLRGTHDGYERSGVKYERELRFKSNQGLVVMEHVRTGISGHFESNFILAPDIAAEINDGSRVVLRPRNATQILLSLSASVLNEPDGEPGTWRCEPAQISPRYGSAVETSKLVFSLRRDADFRVELSFVFGDQE